jgi:hypothetical protein
MESSDGWPTPDEAAVALAEAEASRMKLARGVVLPSFFDAAIGAAITVQIATTALGLADIGGWAGWLLPAGVVVFVLVAVIELARFRRLNGVWLGGFASRVVGGTATAASTSYVLSLGRRGVGGVRTGMVAGGVLRGRRRHGLRVQRSPVAAGLPGGAGGTRPGESAAWLAGLVILAVAGLVLLVVGR